MFGKTKIAPWLICLIATLTGCARIPYAADPAPPGPATQPAAAMILPPVVKKSYVIPFERTKSGLIIVSAILNINPGSPEIQPPAKRMLLDTSCPETCFFLSAEAIPDLPRVFPNATLKEPRIADGSTLQFCEFQPARVSLRNITVDMPVAARAYDMADKPEFEGSLGLDFLRRFDVRIDFTGKTVTLTER